MSKLPQKKKNKKEEAELKELADKPVELAKITKDYPVVEVNYPTEPTFEEREAVARPMTFDSFNEGLVKQVEEGKSLAEIIGNEDGLDEIANKVVLEHAIEKTVPHSEQSLESLDSPSEETVTMVGPITNTSPYAANIQNVNLPDDFIRTPLDELGKVGPYNRYANFPVETQKDFLDDIGYGPEEPEVDYILEVKAPKNILPPVSSLVSPKSVKAIEQAPIVNNGGTLVPQAPQAQPVGRQRHTFKARPDKEGRNV